MKAMWETAVAFKLVWVRMVILVVGPMVTSYLAITQTIDLDVKWESMGKFARAAFWIGITWPGLNALQAFVDQSLARARSELEKKRNGDTQLFTKVDTGP